MRVRLSSRCQLPLTVISETSSGGVLPEPPNGTQRASRRCRNGPQHRDEIAGDRELAHRLGELAARISRPEAPTEKIP